MLRPPGRRYMDPTADLVEQDAFYQVAGPVAASSVCPVFAARRVLPALQTALAADRWLSRRRPVTQGREATGVVNARLCGARRGRPVGDTCARV